MADAIRDLSGKLGLDTTDFKTAIASANRELRVLESGFRASAASLGDWARDATGLEMRIKSLTGQIDLQKAKVAALQQEYTRIASEKGKTSRAAQDLEIKLNKETETLGKMQSELTQSQAALDGMGKEEEDAGEETDDLRKKEDQAEKSTNRFGEALKSLGGKLKDAGSNIRDAAVNVAKFAAGVAVGLAGGVAAVTGGIAALVLKTASGADALVELSDKTGISVERLQELAYIGEQTGTSLDTTTGALARIVRSMDAARKAGSPAAQAFRRLGVPVKEVNGELRDSQEVFQEALDALGRVPNEAERDALAMQLFGKSAQELNPLIKAGYDGMEEMALQARQLGAVISEQDVQAAADFNDKLASLKAGIAGVGMRIASAFIPLATKAADKLQAWLASPAVQKGIEILTNLLSLLSNALQSLVSGNIETAATQFAQLGYRLASMFGASEKDAQGFMQFIYRAITGIPGTIARLSAALAPVKDFITGQLIPAVRDFIQGQLIPFIQQHGPEIKAALAAIGVALGVVAVVVPIVTAVIAALTSPITLIIAAIGLLAAAWAGNWGGIRDKLTAVWAFLQPIFQQIGNWLAVFIPQAIQFLTPIWNATWGQVGERAAAVWAFLSPIFQQIVAWLQTNIPAAINILSGFWTNTLWPAIQNVWSWMSTTLFPFLQSLSDFLGAVFGLAVTALAGLWQNVLYPALEDAWSMLQDNLLPIFKKVAQFMEEKVGPAAKDVGGFIKDHLVEAFKKLNEMLSKAGEWLEKMAAKLNELKDKLPDWLKPGSPTPFELGLRGIASAAKDLASLQVPGLASSLAAGRAAPAMAGRGGDTYIYNQNYYDRSAAALGQAFVETERRKRLNRSMGV